MTVTVTATAPVNIAVIKYWGKRDEELILPINSSLSCTIDQESMCSRTTITASKEFPATTMVLNGKEEAINKRTQRVLAALLARAEDYKAENGAVLVHKHEWPAYKLRIVSHNNFPTAAGLASSASGFACLTRCLAEVYGFRERFPGELSTISRQGSGSACRSLYGGFVKWVKGEQKDGSDSVAVQVAPESHWPDMRVLILVVNAGKKETSSTEGMQESVITSPLLAYRAASLVDPRIKVMEQAIAERDFATFARVTMQDSNQFHATCLDTYPPLFYMNDTSRKIIGIVHRLNDADGRATAAYTFDAGPNAVVYVLAKDMDRVLNLFLQHFLPPATKPADFITDPLRLARPAESMPADAKPQFDPVHTLSRIIVSKLGDGAKIVEKTK